MAYMSKPTKALTAEIRSTAKEMGYKVRCSLQNWSVRLNGPEDQVRDMAVLFGLCGPVGEPATRPGLIVKCTIRGEAEFFGYIVD